MVEKSRKIVFSFRRRSNDLCGTFQHYVNIEGSLFDRCKGKIKILNAKIKKEKIELFKPI